MFVYTKGVKRQDILSILITFTVGLFAGGFLYLNGFVTLFTFDLVKEEEAFLDLVIVGEAYGGCRTMCPTFRMLSDGSYRYIYTSASGEVARSGTFPFALQREIKQSLSPASLAAQAETREPSFCQSYTDGIDVQYEITLDGETYVLDSCGTAVDGEGPLWTALAKLWNHFETGE